MIAIEEPVVHDRRATGHAGKGAGTRAQHQRGNVYSAHCGLCPAGGAQVIVRGLRVISDFELEFQMALTNKKLAPEMEFVCLMTSQEYAFISASNVKEIAMLGGCVADMVPPTSRRPWRPSLRKPATA